MFDPYEGALRFALQHGLPQSTQAAMRAHPNWEPELIDAVLSEAAKFATNVLAPLNHSGDQAGCQIDAHHNVTTPNGFIGAHRAMVDGGWHSIEASEDYGGQNLPKPVCAAVCEMFFSANMALTLCPLLNMGQIHALELYGTDQQKQTYLSKLISGQWVGTMNLTEAHAGTDLAALRTMATPNFDDDHGDHYLLHGQKYISLLVNMIWLKISAIWFWPALRARQMVTKAYRCLLSPNICQILMGNLHSAMMSNACLSNISWALKDRQLLCCNMAMIRARLDS